MHLCAKPCPSDEDLLDVFTYTDLIDSLTSDDIRQAARTYLNTDQYVQVVLYPDSESGDAENE